MALVEENNTQLRKQKAKGDAPQRSKLSLDGLQFNHAGYTLAAAPLSRVLHLLTLEGWVNRKPATWDWIRVMSRVLDAVLQFNPCTARLLKKRQHSLFQKHELIFRNIASKTEADLQKYSRGEAKRRQKQSHLNERIIIKLYKGMRALFHPAIYCWKHNKEFRVLPFFICCWWAPPFCCLRGEERREPQAHC